MTNTAQGASDQAPQNGIAGLKHLQYDVLAGIVVSLVSLPLSSGIAIASGMPPVYGLISAIIAGLVFPLIGGAYVTIAGPAAGLAPALLAIMVTMGGAGDADHVGPGYVHLLVVIFLVGCLQIVLSGLKLARFASIIPVSVVEGMLASIGILILAKQLPMFFGYTGKIHAHEFYEFVTDIPEYLLHLSWPVVAVSVSSLMLLFLLERFQNIRALRVLPPQLVAVAFGTLLGVVLHLGSLNSKFLIAMPAEAFRGAALPDFAGIWARSDLWYAAILGILTLTMIDGVESLATAMAIDRIDPFHRKSDPNRLLLAMGVCNIASSLVGGLTIIPGGVKSKVNVAAGGRTLWANFTNAVCLILYLAVCRDLVNLIPKGVLAAVLIYTGWKMCEPLVWKHVAEIGREQLAIFTLTVVATLLTDLLWGIVIGVVAKLLLNLVLYRAAIQKTNPDQALPGLWTSVADLFRNPVGRREQQGSECHLYLEKPLVCFNSLRLTEELAHLPSGTDSVCVHVDATVGLIDHTACDSLLAASRESAPNRVKIEVVGLDRMRRLSNHHSGAHVAMPAGS